MTDRIAAVGLNTGPFGGDLERLDRILESVRAMGSDLCEIMAGELHAVADLRLLPERVDAVRKTLARHPIRFTLHAPIPINLMDEANLPLQRRAAESCLELAGEIGAEVVVIHPGRVHPLVWAEHGERLLGLERDLLAQLGERAAALGTLIGYENLSPSSLMLAGAETSYALDPSALADQLELLGSPGVVGCLDVSHGWQAAALRGFDFLAACARMAPATRHVHFSDSTSVPQTVPLSHAGERLLFGIGDMHAPPGWGRIDFAALADALPVRRGTTLVVELMGEFIPHSGERTVAAARAFAERVDRLPANAP